MSSWLILLIAFAALALLAWYVGPELVSRLLSVAYKGCYAAGDELPIAYTLGSVSHEIGLLYLKTRLDKNDLRLIPVLEQAAVLLNAQARYADAEKLYLTARKIYAQHLSGVSRPGQKKIDKRTLAQCYANMVFDHASMLEIIDRVSDAKQVLQDGATVIDLAGEKELGATLREKSKTLSDRNLSS